ncbi:unnamed protein product, partial [Protopolystoma xenopodis]
GLFPAVVTTASFVSLKWEIDEVESLEAVKPKPSATGLDATFGLPQDGVTFQSDPPAPRLDFVKHVEPGVRMRLECTVHSEPQSTGLEFESRSTGQAGPPVSVYLTCPLANGVCLEDCKSSAWVEGIQCEELLRPATEPPDMPVAWRQDRRADEPETGAQQRVFRYLVPQVTGRHNGTWACQSRGSSSLQKQLVVSGKLCPQQGKQPHQRVAMGNRVVLRIEDV